MFRFTRTVTVKLAVNIPAALQWATEVTAYLNKAYALDMKFGIEIFGEGKIHWYIDTDSLDKLTAINGKLMQDREYNGLLEKARSLWLEGGLKDTVVKIVG
jgi:hypothetical protein